MRESDVGSSFSSFAITVPQVLLGLGMLVAGLRTEPGALTDDGYSLRKFLIGLGAIFLFTSLGFNLFSTLVRAGNRVEALQLQQLKATGWEGTARIERVERSKRTGNDHYLPVLLTLKVMIPGRAAYRTTWEGEVERTFWGQVRPQEWLKVLVSPDKRQDVHIQWGEPARVPDDEVR